MTVEALPCQIYLILLQYAFHLFLKRKMQRLKDEDPTLSFRNRPAKQDMIIGTVGGEKGELEDGGLKQGFPSGSERNARASNYSGTNRYGHVQDNSLRQSSFNNTPSFRSNRFISESREDDLRKHTSFIESVTTPKKRNPGSFLNTPETKKLMNHLKSPKTPTGASPVGNNTFLFDLENEVDKTRKTPQKRNVDFREAPKSRADKVGAISSKYIFDNDVIAPNINKAQTHPSTSTIQNQQTISSKSTDQTPFLFVNQQTVTSTNVQPKTLQDFDNKPKKQLQPIETHFSHNEKDENVMELHVFGKTGTMRLKHIIPRKNTLNEHLIPLRLEKKTDSKIIETSLAEKPTHKAPKLDDSLSSPEVSPNLRHLLEQSFKHFSHHSDEDILHASLQNSVHNKISDPNNPKTSLLDTSDVTPPPLNSGTLVAFPSKRRLCLFGGMTDQGSTNDTWIFEIGLEKWIRTEFLATRENTFSDYSPLKKRNSLVEDNIPRKRCGHVADTFDNNTMFMFGGGDLEQKQLYNDLWMFKPDPYPVWKCLSSNDYDLSKTPGKPSPRMNAACTAKDDIFIVHGGEGHHFLPLDDFGVFSRENNEWIPLLTVHPKPSARFLHTANLIDNKMIVVGGASNMAFTDTVWSFDTFSLSWQQVKIPTRNSPFENDMNLYGHTASVWGNRLMVIGGLNGSTGEYNDKVWLLDLIANCWVDISSSWPSEQLPTHRYKHMAISDFYSHLNCNTFRAAEKNELTNLAKYQVKKQYSRITGENPQSGNEFTGGSPSMRNMFVKRNSRSNLSEYDHTLLQLPADVVLQKMTRTYIFGGIDSDSNKRASDLWEASLVFNQAKR